jgi:hypothetical protein
MEDFEGYIKSIVNMYPRNRRWTAGGKQLVIDASQDTLMGCKAQYPDS